MVWLLLVAAAGGDDDDYDVVEVSKWIENLLLNLDVYSIFD